MSNAASWIAGASWERIKSDAITRLDREPARRPSACPAGPAWGWLFALAYGLMLLVMFVGLIPSAVDLGGAWLGVTTACNQAVAALRPGLSCVAIVAGCCGLTAALWTVRAFLLR